MEKKTKLKIKAMNLEDFIFSVTLGTGSFGRVRLAKNKQNKAYLAIKIMKKSNILKQKQGDHIQNEFVILSQVNHPFIVNFQGMAQDDKFLFLGLEFVIGGELFMYLREKGRLDINQAMFYAAQVTSIFEYLHSKNIIYRDLKPENLLIDEKGYLKLTDFGFAKVVEDRTYTLCGTPEYLAPEMLLHKGHGKPVDWWTLGILLYEMVAGIDPFSDEDPMNIYQKILAGVVKFPKLFDKNCKSLVGHLLEEDLTKRYGNLKNGVNDVKEHRFFNNVIWPKLLKKEIPASYIPEIKGLDDTSHFPSYPDSSETPDSIPPKEDPFLKW